MGPKTGIDGIGGAKCLVWMSLLLVVNVSVAESVGDGVDVERRWVREDDGMRDRCGVFI